MQSSVWRHNWVRVLVALGLLATPFIIVSVTDIAGTRRGLWVVFAGVLLGVVAERPFRPYNVTAKRWPGRKHWIEVALTTGIALGLLFSFADLLGQGAPMPTVIEKIWIPFYRAVMLTVGLTLLRRTLWEMTKTVRTRGQVHEEKGNVQVTPALPRRKL